MKPPHAVLGMVMACGLCRGASTEEIILAAMTLSEQPNYTWTATIADDARTYEVEGKTDVSGYTWMRLPMVRSIARRLGREADRDIEAFFKGASTAVIRTERGWRLPRELPAPRWDSGDDMEFWPAPRSTVMGAASRIGLDPLDLPPVVVARPRPAGDDRVYSNAQFAVSRPHEELAVIISSFTELRSEGENVIGTLSDLGAQLLLVRDGQDHITPLCAAGHFKLQLSRGIVTKYSVRLEGVLLVDRKKIHVHQAATTVVTRIGSTTFVIPDEAYRKLGP